jgi:hypothetical protein
MPSGSLSATQKRRDFATGSAVGVVRRFDFDRIAAVTAALVAHRISMMQSFSRPRDQGFT